MKCTIRGLQRKEGRGKGRLHLPERIIDVV